MDEKNSLQNLQFLRNLRDETFKNIISDGGFTQDTFLRFYEDTGELAPWSYLLAPSALLVAYSSLTGRQLTPLYSEIGRSYQNQSNNSTSNKKPPELSDWVKTAKKEETEFEKRRKDKRLKDLSGPHLFSVPGWVQFLAKEDEGRRREKSGEYLDPTLEEDEKVGSFSSVVKESLEKLIKIEYVLNLEVETTFSRNYQHLEDEIKELPSTQKGKKLYVTSLRWKHLSQNKAEQLFKFIYERLPELYSGQFNQEKMKYEVHNNKEGIHEPVKSLEDAMDLATLPGTIAKVDTPKINLYLKKNGSYGVELSFLGTKKLIKECVAAKVQELVSDFYLQKLEKELEIRKSERPELKETEAPIKEAPLEVITKTLPYYLTSLQVYLTPPLTATP